MADYQLGFQSLQEERSDRRLPIEGVVPNWLAGTLYRNGPGLFEVGGEQFDHWFDGLAMVRRFSFQNGSIAYSNRFLRTETYRRAHENGTLDSPQFGTTASGFLSTVKTVLRPTATDNTNVNITRTGETLLALTETPRYTAFESETLKTIGEWTFEDDVSSHLTCAHPIVDPATDTTLNLHTTFGRTHTYQITERPTNTTSRTLLGEIDTDTVGYMHSFGVTPGYVILVEPPLVVDLRSLLNPFVGSSFLDALTWRPQRGTRFLVVDRTDGKLAATIDGAPFFYFHVTNAFEVAEGELAIDLVTFEDASVLQALSLTDLSAGNFSHPMGDLDRFHVSIPETTVDRERLVDGHLSLPRMNDKYVGRRYRYVYSQGADADDRSEFPTGLRKIDSETGEVERWSTPDRYFGEPIFVARPRGTTEDDGVILSVFLDTDREQSGLLILDGKSFEKRATAWLPHIVPFDFHGQYFRR
ncbi:Lignostilbene-alpha,beta-dioxygenase or related enzyme [Halanaeroarchaeum sp. HSR-CO]|uniref:carotenoid oxygenase family protein n=1 Tax=Halanaeroarchaeum sp. HSR-CO TaxID=2866382 RepID=UPI00217E50D0|nr:carotenoid oxygenase family protein [Halanaeroarchaeum sp. HSR-CO]UWG47543.1 Lignostilbene-alpha,beta-dioxygenase or related enzyme [Halanaeroarchaeum sp. HSR-CO]